MKLAILGAGAIGCWVGGVWAPGLAASGGRLTLVGREATLALLRQGGLSQTGQGAPAKPAALDLQNDPAVLAEADVIALAMKAHALPAAMAQIDAHARKGVVLISLLNGIAPVRTLRGQFADHRVIAGMVPYNVVWAGPGHLNRSGIGHLALERHAVSEALQQSGAEIELHDDLQPIQYGKLLLNLVNAVNALSGLPLYQMLSERGYRRVFAASLAEALAVYDAGGIQWQEVGANNPKLARRMLSAPDWLFRWAVLRKAELDRGALTSMAQDIQTGRPTEIDVINGEILRLGAAHDVPTPVNRRLVALIKAAEQSGERTAMDAATLQREVGV